MNEEEKNFEKTAKGEKEVAIPRSLRLSDSAMERFNAIKDDLKLNQDGAMKMLLKAFEMEDMKTVMADRETEISNFQLKVQELIDAYVFSLQLNADAEKRVRQEFSLKIESMEKTIANYQVTLEEANTMISTLKGEKVQLETSLVEVNQLRIDLERSMDSQVEFKAIYDKQLRDKDELLSMLQDKLTAASEKAEAYDRLLDEKNTLLSELMALQSSNKEREHQFELQTERAARAAEKEQEIAVAAVRAEATQTVSRLQQQLQQAQIDAERQMRTVEKEYSAEIRALDQENARLRELIAGLQPKK